MKSLDPLRHVKYVLAVAEHGSMRRAALEIGVQESTVSRHVSAIEQYLDLQLFERRSDGIRLTNEGKYWLDAIQKHVEGLEETLQQIARRSKEVNTLRVGFCAPVGQEFLLRLVDRFRRKQPDVKLVIRDSSCGTLADAIRRRHLDVAFMFDFCETRACASETIREEGSAFFSR